MTTNATKNPAAAAIAPAASDSIAAFEARATDDGVLDADGFFTQEDWEFAADTMQPIARTALEQRLATRPVDQDTAAFLKGYLMNQREIHFNAFDD